MLSVYDRFSEDTRSDKGLEKGRMTISWKHFMQLRISPLNIYTYVTYIGLPRWCRGKEPTCQRKRGKRRTFGTWVGLEEGMVVALEAERSSRDSGKRLGPRTPQT